MRYRTKRTYRPHVISTTSELEAMVDDYRQLPEFVFDVETRGEHRGVGALAQVAWIGFAGPDRVDLVPCGHINGRMLRPAGQRRQTYIDEETDKLAVTEKGNLRYKMVEIPAVFDEPPKQLWATDVFEIVRPLFFSEQRKIGQGVRFDLNTLRKYFGGERIPKPYGDTMIAHHVLNENRKRYGLEFLVRDNFKAEYSDGKLGKIGIDKFPFDTVARYLAQDVRYTWLLWLMAQPGLDVLMDADLFEEPFKMRYVFDFEMELLRPFCSMDWYGIPVSLERRDQVREILDGEAKRLKTELHKARGKVWNINATAEKIQFVYVERGHKPTKVTAVKQEPSTEADVIKRIGMKDPVVGKLAEYAQVNKYLGTYVEGIEEHLIEGRIRPNFSQVGTTTGRASCSEPNMQNLPREREEEKRYSIRSMYVAPPGYRMIVADYDQIELRLIAHLSEDPTMLRIFGEGEDIHRATAAMILSKDPADINSEERTVYGKVINFAIAYGAGPGEVGRQAKISTERARSVLARHAMQFPAVYAWKAAKLREARRFNPPGVYTIAGRRRRLPELVTYRDEKDLWHAQRQAINTIVQGSAGDILKSGMIRLDDKFEGSGCELVAAVHDEVVTLVPEDKVEWAEKWVRICLEGAWDGLLVPITCAVNVCSNWADGK